MELPQWASFLVVVLATVLFLKAALRRRRQYNLPPGPKPWPIIGNLNLIGTLPHRSIHALSKKYGPLMQLQFGSFPVVVGSSVEMAKFFLKTHDVAFTDRPKTAAGRYTTYNYSDITWSPYGAYWRQARKMCLTELFSAKRLESYEYIRKEEVLALLGNLYRGGAGAGRVVVLKDYLSTVSLNVITRMVMGKKYLEKEVRDEAGAVITTPEEFKWMIDELFLLNGVLNIGDSIPWLDWMDLQGYIKRMKKLSKKFDRFLEHVVDEHSERRRREGGSFVVKDMVDVLLQFASDPDLEVKLNREGVKAFTQGIFPTWSIGRDPELWKMPEEFMPERFLDSNLDVKGQNYELLPFGSGRRMCPGYSLGLKVIQVSLANLLHGFTWRLPDGMELSMEEIFGLSTPRKFPLEAVVEPKLPAHLYNEAPSCVE